MFLAFKVICHELHSTSNIILLYNSPLYYSRQHVGYDSYSCEVDADDVHFWFQYATRKQPLPVPSDIS